MKKTSVEDLNQWRFDQKRNPVSVRISGDQNLGNLYLGEAKSLLYSVKNAMSFNKLMQGEGEREIDGTRIRAWSIFGQDFIEIDTTHSIMLISSINELKCTITFINLPLSVQPMQYPGEIRDGEMVGVDYIKTYYQIDVSKCPTCRTIEFNFSFDYETPLESRHYYNFQTEQDELNNH